MGSNAIAAHFSIICACRVSVHGFLPQILIKYDPLYSVHKLLGHIHGPTS